MEPRRPGRIDPVWLLCGLALIAVCVMVVSRYVAVSRTRDSAAVTLVEKSAAPEVAPERAGEDKPVVSGSTAPGSAAPGSVTPKPSAPPPDPALVRKLIVNTGSKTFHADPDCRAVKQMKAENRRDEDVAPESLLAQGYKPCGLCAKEFAPGE